MVLIKEIPDKCYICFTFYVSYHKIIINSFNKFDKTKTYFKIRQLWAIRFECAYLYIFYIQQNILSGLINIIKIMQAQLQHIFPADNGIVKCGCYVRNPNAIGIQYNRALVPLRHIDYQLEIVNSLLNVTLSQKYYNPTENYLEVDYSLPINPDSSIYKFEAEFGNVKIQGIVKEKEQAKKQYEQAKSQGRQAVIGTIDADSKDILNLQIGNIPPKTEFTVRISLLQQMKISLNTFYRLQIPSTISPRYMNAVDGVTKVSQHMQQKGQSSGKPDFDWSFKLDLKTTRKVIFFDSPSHNVTLLNQNQKGTQTLLVMEKSQKPNKDFIFVYTTQDFHLPSYVVGSTDTSSTVMLSFIPKFCRLDINDAYKASVDNKPYQTDMSTAKGDYIFFLDRSGSMGGTRIKKAKQALVLFLKSLPQDSFFNIISFGSGSQNMFGASQRYGADKVEQAIHNVEKMDADMGGTQIYQPLQLLLQQNVQQGYPRHVFILTDGGVSNTQGVIKMVKKSTKYCRVHCIGIGNGASFDLIQGCADNGKGKYIMISDDENPAEKIIQLLQTTLTPLISKINLKCPDENQIQSIVPNPKSIPYILKDDVVNFYITFKGPLTQKKSFTFEYEDSVTKLPYKSTIQIQPPTTTLNQPFVDKMAHLKVLRSLQNSAKDGVSIQDQMYYVKTKDFKSQAINYSVKHQVLSEYTAFICIGKQLVDGQYQQFKQKQVQKIHVEQPKPIQYQERFKSVQSSAPGGNVLYCMAPPPAASYSRQLDSLSSRSQQLDLLCEQSSNLSMESANFKLSSAKKKSAGFGLGDIMGAIGDKFTNFFSSNESQKASNVGSMPSSMAQSIPQKQQNKRSNIPMRQSRDMPPLPIVQPIPQVNYYQSESISRYDDAEVDDRAIKDSTEHAGKKSIDINSIVKMQAPNGSWNNAALIDKLAKNAKQAHQKVATLGADLVVTQLVVTWMQKYHTDKQYALIVKKALAWIKKTLAEKGITQDQLKDIESV